MPADIICYWKMTSYMALGGITSFLHLKDITNTCKSMHHTKYWQEFFSAMVESWKKLKTSNVFSLFIVYYKRNRSALM